MFGSKKITKAPLIINVNGLAIFFVFTVMLSFFSLAGVGIYYTYSTLSAEFAYREVSERNKRLVSTLESLKTRVQRESKTVEKISQLETDLSLHYGIAPTADEIKKLSIGGRHSFVDKARMMLGSPLEKSIAVVEEDILSNKRQVDFLRPRLESISEEADRQNNYFAEKPSIYPVTGRITSEFGSRFHPVLDRVAHHEGLDIANAMWTPIRAAADGTVVYSGIRGAYGIMVQIEHKRSGYITRYAHLADSKVRVGDRVKRGDIIGSLGNSGLSTGPHLHYEVRQSGGVARNPKHYLICSETNNAIID